MRRRQYLYAATGALTATIAGCSESSDGGDEDDETTEETTDPEDDGGASLPQWSEWVPADAFPDPDAELFVLDIQRAREEFPEQSYDEFGMSDVADVYGVAESDMAYLVGLERGTGSISAVTGDFDSEAMVDTLGVPDDRIETVRGYQVVDGEIALGDSAILIGQDYEEFIDARTGETPSLGTTDDDWRELLVASGDGTLVGIQDGSISDDGQSPLETDVTRSAVEIDSAGGQQARLTAHFMFDSEDRAGEVLEDNRQDIIGEARREGDDSIQSVEREGKRVVVVIRTDTFDF